MTYESIKIYDTDYAKAREQALLAGCSVIEFIGRAVDAWEKLSERQQRDIIRTRGQRRLAADSDSSEPLAAAG